MNADLTDLMAIGLVALVFGVGALFLLVRGDLAVAGNARGWAGGGGPWFLGAALGLGVIAFAIKLAIISVIAAAPRRTIAPLVADTLERWSSPPEMAGDLADVGGRVASQALWRPLPLQAPAPPDNKTTPEKVALGERLFHDPRLSRDGRVACASCHDVWGRAGADGRAGAVGVTGVPGKRNAPTVWNAAFQSVQFWDGRAASLEEQAKGPPVNPDEMGMPSLDAVVARVAADPSYPPEFERAFGPGQAITIDTVAAAIASFERTLITADSPYDRFVRGDPAALDERQRRGMWLFQSVGCQRCHAGPNFSGASVFSPVSPFRPLMASRSAFAARFALAQDRGRAPAGARDGVWRIPSLRNVALTAPYFHNGSVDTLADAVRVMATSQLNAVLSDDPREGARVIWSPERLEFTLVARLRLSSADIQDIVAFLEALTGDALAARNKLAQGIAD